MLLQAIEGEPALMYAYPAAGPSGDDDVFIAMCEQHRRRLVAYCRRRLGAEHEAEDAAHEVLLRAYRALPGYDSSSDAWPWLRTIATRVCTDMQRRAARSVRPEDLDASHAVDDVHEQVVGRLRADILDDALGRLAPRYRTSLLLREYAGWSYDDIARTQGQSLPSVRSLLTRSRRRLGVHVESVARSRGQWPLPGAVPPLRRARDVVRSWRHPFDRSGQAALGMFELSSVASRWLVGVQATLAGLMALGSFGAAASFPPPTAAALRPSPPSPTTVTAEARVPSSAPVQLSATVSADAPAPASPDTGTFKGVALAAPVPSEHNPVSEPSAGVADYDETMRVEWDAGATLPVVGDVDATGHYTVQCTWDEVRATVCTAARLAGEHVPPA